MKFKQKRILSAVLVMTMLLSGCQTASTASSQAPSQPQSQAPDTGQAPQGTGTGVPFDQTFEFSMLSMMGSPYKADTTLIPEFEKATNTKINVEWAPQENYATKINTVIASGKIPDVILCGNSQIVMSLIDQGAIIPLNEYYETITPNINKFLKPEDYPFIRNVNDGKMYGLYYGFDFAPSLSWVIRQDWLDRVSKKAPETWGEWIDVWKAFRDNDANGDGNKNNEIPIVGDQSMLLSAFGINNGGDFCLMPNGDYSVIYEHPNYKTYLETMEDLYAEKLFDPEFATRVQNEQYKAIDNNIGGSGLVYAEQAKLSTLALRENDPKAALVGIAPPKGPLGDQGIAARARIQYSGVVTVAAQKSGKVENIMKFFDWMYSDEGVMMTNYGVEGKHYDIADGKPTLRKPYIDSFVEARGAGLACYYYPFLWTEDNYMQILLNGKEYEQLDDETKIFYDALFMNEDYFFVRPPTLVTDAYSKYQTDIMGKIKELQANAIIGRISVDEFFKQYEALKEKGLQEIISEANTAWKTVS